MKRNCINEMKLVFPSDSRNESYARYAVTAFVAQLDPTTEELADIRTAVSEAVTNGIIHGYRGTRGNIQVEATLYEDRTVRIRVKDKGCGISDIKQAMEPLYTTCPSEERSGMGFTVIAGFSDKLKVSSDVGKGTTVTIEKKVFGG